MESELRFLPNGDVKIPYYTWPVNRPRAVLIFLHGLKSHSGWFLETGSALAQREIKVYLTDRRGSGRSEYTRGDIEDYRHWFEDIRAIVNLAGNQNPGVPLHLLGHCFGAKLAMGFALTHPGLAQGLILIAPPQCSLKVDITFSEKCKVAAALLLRRNWGVQVPIRDDMFTRNLEKIRFIREDALKLETMTTRLCWEIFKMDLWLNRRLPQLKQPTLVLLADEDQVVDNEKIKDKFFPRVGSSQKALEVFDCMHDLFFEPERERVIDRIANWVTR